MSHSDQRPATTRITRVNRNQGFKARNDGQPTPHAPSASPHYPHHLHHPHQTRQNRQRRTLQARLRAARHFLRFRLLEAPGNPACLQKPPRRPRVEARAPYYLQERAAVAPFTLPGKEYGRSYSRPLIKGRTTQHVLDRSAMLLLQLFHLPFPHAHHLL